MYSTCKHASMKALRFPLVFLAAALIGALSVSAQTKKPLSPHDTVTAEIDGAKLSLSYGRPYTKDPKTGEIRKIWGGLVPYGKVWRTGANEATVLTTDKSLVFGSTTIPAGSYSLWTVPEEDGSAKLIFNKQTGQWGTKYDGTQDFASVAMTKHALPAQVNQFTMALEKGSAGGGEIRLEWELTEYIASFTVAK